MKIHIIGPITGNDDYVKDFDAAAIYLRALGHDVWSPAEYAEQHPGLCYEEYMAASMEHLREADAVYALDDFDRSPGAVREYCVAKYVLGLEVKTEAWPPAFYLCNPELNKKCEKRGCYLHAFNEKRECALTWRWSCAVKDARTGEAIPEADACERIRNRLTRFGE